MTQYQTATVNARLRLFALLEAQGVSASEADDLVAALEAGAVAGAQCQVVELDGMAPRPRSPEFEDGWDAGVTAVSEARVVVPGIERADDVIPIAVDRPRGAQTAGLTQSLQDLAASRGVRVGGRQYGSPDEPLQPH
ncbi:hypothetical protein ACF07L_35625 [Streptomyces anulatus]|uniref:hypothetical protein n=1 Tax=Streptomyces anulatus TaxID=1892 RepID=UPI00370187B9